MNMIIILQLLNINLIELSCLQSNPTFEDFFFRSTGMCLCTNIPAMPLSHSSFIVERVHVLSLRNALKLRSHVQEPIQNIIS